MTFGIIVEAHAFFLFTLEFLAPHSEPAAEVDIEVEIECDVEDFIAQLPFLSLSDKTKQVPQLALYPEVPRFGCRGPGTITIYVV